jgi:uncharacterized protein (TIGR03382 family)
MWAGTSANMSQPGNNGGNPGNGGGDNRSGSGSSGGGCNAGGGIALLVMLAALAGIRRGVNNGG